MEASEHRLGSGVGFLQFHAPIFQFVERNRLAGDRAANERARADDAIIAVEIAKLGFAGGKWNALKAIHAGIGPGKCDEGKIVR
jgi:hypothetical protein